MACWAELTFVSDYCMEISEQSVPMLLSWLMFDRREKERERFVYLFDFVFFFSFCFLCGVRCTPPSPSPERGRVVSESSVASSIWDAGGNVSGTGPTAHGSWFQNRGRRAYLTPASHNKTQAPLRRGFFCAEKGALNSSVAEGF